MRSPAPLSGLSIPAVAAPMFLISNPNLVVECCTNGIVGSFPALNQRSSDGFEQWLIEINTRLEQFHQIKERKLPPYAVNLIMHSSNTRLQSDLELCSKYKVPIIISSLGLVPSAIDAIHDYGGLVFHDVINRRHAEKASAAGVDGLILVSAGAGGHGGTINPIALVSEIRQFFTKTILLSGCISTGQDIASAMQMGADLAYMGTRFINTTESLASEGYQNMIIESGASDIVSTAAISGINANFLRSSLESMGITQEMWENKGKMDFEDETGEAAAWKTIWSAGQGVNSINDVLPTSELIERLKQEFYQALREQSELLKSYTEQNI
ncbi:MAG: nitronate monooxygenase [Bacteroidetes bacterium]|nr:nitronate monooxygenase [Bacteroidota bacterium]